MANKTASFLSEKTVIPHPKPVGWWHAQNGRIACDLCPRACSLKDGDFGFCFVRQNVGGQMMLDTYGRSTGFCIDPVEKKPLNHFYPGSSVLSFGTAGCNLGCKFCQAWEITKSKQVLHRLSQQATPEMIAEAAVRLGCKSVAFTYNDPVIWAEYAIDTAKACHERGLKTIAVTAGYISPEPRKAFFEVMDATNIDLKGFTEHFYQHLTLSHLEPVLDTLKWVRHASDAWLEITNLVIPNNNDDRSELLAMSEWILRELGDDVPVHFTAFHPDYRMMETPRTPRETLVTARDIAMNVGLKYVYVGNVRDNRRENTHCPGCGKLVIERHGYKLGVYRMEKNRCRLCGHKIAGHFAIEPGDWGAKRIPVDPAALLRKLETGPAKEKVSESGQNE